MWILILPLAAVAVVLFLVNKNGSGNTNNQKSNERGTEPIKRGATPSPSKPTNPRQSQIDRDKEIAKKIFIYGGGACLILLVAGIIFALNPNKGVAEKSETIQRIGLPIVAILAVIGIGSILPNKSAKASGKSKENNTKKKDDGFYKPYFCDEYGHPHYPSDPDFMYELRRYSDRNARYHNVTFKDYEKDWYIVDEYGNSIKIFNQSVITMRDSRNNYCKIVFK